MFPSEKSTNAKYQTWGARGRTPLARLTEELTLLLNLRMLSRLRCLCSVQANTQAQQGWDEKKRVKSETIKGGHQREPEKQRQRILQQKKNVEGGSQ